MSQRWTVRSVEFASENRYFQGRDMTWENIVVECDDEEEVFAIDRISMPNGFDMLTPVLRAWIRKRIA